MNYYYWASTLPMLKWDSGVPFSAAEFDSRMAEVLSAHDGRNFAAAALLPDASAAVDGALAAFWTYETLLRNAIVRRRAAGNAELLRNLRPEHDFFADVEAVVQEASALSALDKERALDRARWRFLDDLEAGHAFDGDFFVIYKLKLALLGKYAGRTAADGETGFHSAVAAVLENSENSHKQDGA